MMSRRIKLFGTFLLFVVSVGIVLFYFNRPISNSERCKEQPPFEETDEQLIACLTASSSAEDIENLLQDWDRMYEGKVIRADVLPGGGQEFIVQYSLSKAEALPRNYIRKTATIILQKRFWQWQVANFDTTLYDGKHVSYTEYGSEVTQVLDATGDGFDDVWVAYHYNTLRTIWEAVGLLSVHSSDDPLELRLIFRGWTDRTYSFVEIDDGIAIQSVRKPHNYTVITQTYIFNNEIFDLAQEETQNPTIHDIPRKFHLTYNPETDWHIYNCTHNFSHPHGSGTTRKLCGMKSDGRERRLILYLASEVAVSADGQWFVFAGGPEHELVSCDETGLYKMSETGDITTLIPTKNHMHICGLTHLELLDQADKLWIQFQYWDGTSDNSYGDHRPSDAFYYVDVETGDLKYELPN
ncbi:MAG: hypothetical protein AAF485_12390 [Chloroflexota bacterium]